MVLRLLVMLSVYLIVVTEVSANCKPNESADALEGYVFPLSVANDGKQSVEIYATSPQGAFSVAISRVSGVEKPVAIVGSIPGEKRGCGSNPHEGVIWPRSWAVPVRNTWRSGIYALNLIDGQSKDRVHEEVGYKTYFIVRDR